jgi:hypothetical protein
MNTISSPKFFEAGHAIFTVGNGKGEHYTFKIGHSKPEQPLFVSLLTGPSNESDYTYLGIYNPNTGSVGLTKSSKFNDGSTPVKVVRWAVNQVRNNKELPGGYSINHAGKCCRCGRTLTTPESCERGIGPECVKLAGWA